MDDSTFDPFIRHATGAVSRRGPFLLLGGASLAGAFAPKIAGAGKAGTKRKHRCNTLGERCRRAVVEDCEGQLTCLEAVLPCCEHVAQCRVEAAVLCLMNGVT